MSEESERLIITGSFNGLLDRIAKIDFFHVWLSGTKILKKAKKEGIEATIKMSEVSTLTGLTREDLELFTFAIPLIEIVEGGDDPLLSFKDVFCLVKIFERAVDEG